MDASRRLSQAIEAGAHTHALRRRELSRAENIVRSCMAHSRSEQHLVNMLHRAGISMHVAVSEDGIPFGLTFVDHRTRTAFKGSELHGALTVAMMQEAVSSGAWREHDRGQRGRRRFRRGGEGTSVGASARQSGGGGQQHREPVGKWALRSARKDVGIRGKSLQALRGFMRTVPYEYICNVVLQSELPVPP